MSGVNFVTSGAWGEGLGTLLSAAQIDHNFFHILSRVVTLEGSLPSPASIADLTIDGVTFRLHLTNGDVLGPYQLPAAGFDWRGAWEAETAYGPFHVFFVAKVGLFMSLRTHESSAEFDASEETTEGPLYHTIFSYVPSTLTTVHNVAEAAYSITDEDVSRFLRFTVGATLTIQADADVELPIDAEFVVRQSSADPVTFIADGDASLDPVEGKEFETAFEGAVVYFKKRDDNAWFCWGDLADAVTEPSTGTE